MIKRIVAFLMTTQLLIGSILLPLGDFSLLNDLPKMYRAYEKIAAPDERGVFDFVGDYLLGGKDLLNHNRHDRPEAPGAMQFQHTATFAIILPQGRSATGLTLHQPSTECVPVYILRELTTYHNSLFRPPLA